MELITRFWHQNLKWFIVLWFIAAYSLHTSLLIMGIGAAVWVILVYFTAPGVFWTYLYELPVNSSNPKRALGLLQKAISYKPQIALPYTALGIAHFKARRWGEAIPLLEEAARLAYRKSASEIKSLLAVAYRETGDYSKTYALLDELVGRGVRDFKIYYNYALCYLQQKRLEEALEAAEKACSLNTNINLLEPRLLLGLVHFKMGNIRAAKDIWESAVNKQPQLVEPYYWLGRAELELGQTQAAVDHLKLAVSRITKNPSFSNVTAEEAEEWLKKAKAGKK